MSLDVIRCVVVKLEDERAWIAACMSADSYDVIGFDDWDEWRAKALDLVVPDWRAYDIREIEVNINQADLDGLFATGETTGAVVLPDNQEQPS